MGFILHCSGAAGGCSEIKDRLVRLAKYLEAELITIEDLEDAALGGGPVPPVSGQDEQVLHDELEAEIGQLNSTSTREAVKAVLGKLASSEDRFFREAMLPVIRKQAGLSIPVLRKGLRDGAARAPDERGSLIFAWKTRPFGEVMSKLSAALLERNAAKPDLFNMGTARVRLVTNPETSRVETEVLDREAFRQVINAFTTWFIPHDTGPEYISCPNDVAENLVSDPALSLPTLRGLAHTPFFDAAGNLVTAPGYHADSRIYLQLRPGLNVPQVSLQPAALEVQRALELLMGNAYVDFPFEKGVATAAKAHILVMTLQPFARELIQGATPIYMIIKLERGVED
jgi:hypothetical protein